MTDTSDVASAITTDELVLPHYKLFLEPGVAMLSRLEGDSWVVRFIYDPVDYEAMELLRDPFHQDPTVRPPLIVAIGDPGEPRKAVEQVFLEAVCDTWCRSVGQRTDPDPVDLAPFAGGVFTDVWTGENKDHDLLCMIRTAKSIADFAGGHQPVRVSDAAIEEWEDRAAAQYEEKTYFASEIPIWRAERVGRNGFFGDVGGLF